MPVPKYSSTESVGNVITYLKGVGCNTNLSIKILSGCVTCLVNNWQISRLGIVICQSLFNQPPRVNLSGLVKQSRSGHSPTTLVKEIWRHNHLPSGLSRTHQFIASDKQGLYESAELFLSTSKPLVLVKAYVPHSSLGQVYSCQCKYWYSSLFCWFQ